MSQICPLANLTASPDHEIFRLRDEVQATEGEDVTFYGMSDHAVMPDHAATC